MPGLFDGADPFTRIPMLFALIVLGLRDSENVNTIGLFRLMPLDPLAGVTVTTAGEVVSEPVPVENVA
jgi:hypothetical protein